MDNNIYKKLEQVIDKEIIKYNEPLAKHNTMKVGGPCKALIEVRTVDDIVNSINFAKKNNIKYYILGNGSDVFATDKGFNGIIIKIAKYFSDIKRDGNFVTATSGVGMPRLSMYCYNEGLKGLEFACGIPGTIGGGVRMNAGAYGSQMDLVVYQTKYLDEKGNIKTLSKEDHEFRYRHSYFADHPEYIIIETTFKLEEGNKEEIKAIMDKNNAARREKQPLEYASSGSTFKRPEGYFVGKIIEESNLKGYHVGDAEVSTKHGGFVVNKGKASAKDVMDVIEHVQKVIKENYGIDLETEVIIIGEK